jgi:hypothetical protein
MVMLMPRARGVVVGMVVIVVMGMGMAAHR